NIPYNQCGKVIVATEEAEVERMKNLYQRGLENGLDVELLDGEYVRKIEPYVIAVAGIHVKNTGIVDYSKVTEKLIERIQQYGGERQYNIEEIKIEHDDDGLRVKTNIDTFDTKYLVNCAILYNDNLAKLSVVKTDVKIIPFREEYFKLSE